MTCPLCGEVLTVAEELRGTPDAVVDAHVALGCRSQQRQRAAANRCQFVWQRRRCRVSEVLPFICRCGARFCAKHRLPEQHHCALRAGAPPSRATAVHVHSG